MVVPPVLAAAAAAQETDPANERFWCAADDISRLVCWPHYIYRTLLGTADGGANMYRRARCTRSNVKVPQKYNQAATYTEKNGPRSPRRPAHILFPFSLFSHSNGRVRSEPEIRFKNRFSSNSQSSLGVSTILLLLLLQWRTLWCGILFYLFVCPR